MADQKFTELGAITLPAAADIMAIIDDVSGTPITKKITHDDVLFGANGTPSTQAHGDSAAIGTALDAARSDHKHAMPTEQVIQAEETTGSSPSESVTWNSTFSGTPVVTATAVASVSDANSNEVSVYVSARSTTAATAKSFDVDGVNRSHVKMLIAMVS